MLGVRFLRGAFGAVAQLVEQPVCRRLVVSSILTRTFELSVFGFLRVVESCRNAAERFEMNVTYKIRQEVTEQVAQLAIVVPTDKVLHEDHGEWPHPDAIDGNAQTVTVRVCVESGRIVGWPKGVTYSALWKPRDSGTYILLDEAGDEVERFEDDYVPRFCYWGEGGDDYIEMNVSEDGTIANFHDTFTAARVAEALDEKYDGDK